MAFPGVGRAVFIAGSSGGGTGRTTDWSTYDGTNDTAWQQWVDDSSTALGTDYQVANGQRNVAGASSGGFFCAINNNGLSSVVNFVPDEQDATSLQVTLSGEHDLGTSKVLMRAHANHYILGSLKDSGTIVVYDNSLADSGKISGFIQQSIYNSEDDNFDFLVYPTLYSHGEDTSDFTYPYYYHAKADGVLFRYPDSAYRPQIDLSIYQKGDANNGGGSTGDNGIADLIATPSKSPSVRNTLTNVGNQYGDIFDDSLTQRHFLMEHMRNHFYEDSGFDFNTTFGPRRETSRHFLVFKQANDTANTTEQFLKLEYIDSGGDYGGNVDNGGFLVNPSLHSETSYRGNSDFRYYKSTGRSDNNYNTSNWASLVMGTNLVVLYNDDSGTNGGNLYVTAATDTNETASSQIGSTTSHDGGTAELMRFDEVTTDDTHSNNAKIVSTTNSSDSTNTTFDPEASCIGELHADHFGVAWRQGTTAYVSIFKLTTETSDVPTITRVADSINLGTVPNAGRMAISKLGNGVAAVLCGNYYRIIKTDAE